MAAKLDVVVRKLSKLAIIETHLLLLGRDTQAEARNEVHEEENDASHDEGVGKSSNTVGELVSELDVVLVEPTAGDDAEAVEVRNVVAKDFCVSNIFGTDILTY